MLLINYKLVMCKFTSANCGKHTALHGKPNTFTGNSENCRFTEAGTAIILMFLPNSENCRFVDASWCCNSAHKQALQWFWCFCLMLLSKSCACMLQHTIEADCGQHTALHGKPNTFKETLKLPIRWCKLMLQQRSQAGTAMILMFSAWCS